MWSCVAESLPGTKRGDFLVLLDLADLLWGSEDVLFLVLGDAELCLLTLDHVEKLGASW